jgi:hypothetical protein
MPEWKFNGFLLLEYQLVVPRAKQSVDFGAVNDEHLAMAVQKVLGTEDRHVRHLLANTAPSFGDLASLLAYGMMVRPGR